MLHQRLEYLRPILGLIHSGGLRFKDPIEAAFKRQASMLLESRERLVGFQSATPLQNISTHADNSLLRALWPRSRELHYVVHYREPLDLDVGDIGYITGSYPARFVRLANVYKEITDSHFTPQEVEPFRCLPPDRWTRENINGIMRCVLEA
jgi:hypothetical protein